MSQYRRKRVDWIIKNHRDTIEDYLKLMDQFEAEYGPIEKRPFVIDDPEEWKMQEKIQAEIRKVTEEFMDEFLTSETVALNTVCIARRLIERNKI